MPQQKISTFETTLQKTNAILKEIEEYFGWHDRNMAYLALRSVLQTLRDRLPVEQAAGFGAQLPMLVRGFYYEGWKPGAVPFKMKKEEFLGEVERILNPPFEQSTEEIIKGVLFILEKHIDGNEIQKIKKLLPKDIIQIIS